MTPSSGKQRVFLVRGTRKIREIPAADILVCEKMTWALIGSHRFLLGTTAFFTRKAAEARKLGELRKLEKAAHMLWYKAPGLFASVTKQLAEFDATGTIH